MEEKFSKFLKVSKLRNSRTIFVILGDDGIFKVPVLYNLVVARKNLLPVVWFSNNSPDLRKIGWTTEQNDSSKDNNGPQVTHVSFKDVQKVPLQPCRFTVIQNMKNIRPTNLTSIVESVSGKGALVFIFSKIKEIDKFTSPKVCDLSKSRFMKRLYASLISCPRCIILDDKLNILFSPANKSSHQEMVQEPDEQEPSNFPKTDDDLPGGLNSLNEICSTEDQSKFLMLCLDALKRRSIHCTISASSPRGRGKSLVLGLAIAGAIHLKYSNIFISSLSYDNVKIVLKYLLKGLDAMQFKEGEDYDVIQSINPKFNNALLGLNIFRDHPQAVRFILPGDVENKLEQAELVVIDEAAAMPLRLLKKLLGPYIVLMASTIEGCGGTGKYLYENMISEIRSSSSLKNKDNRMSLESMFPTSETSSWQQITLSKPINYSFGDEVESWINHSLCLEYNIATPQGCPDPASCRLFYVCKETLFSYEPYAEKFLQQLMSLFFSVKRTVSPDILKNMADDDDYHIFCLLPPFGRKSEKGSSDILCAILVHKENRVPWNIVYSGVNQSGGLKDCFCKWTSPSSGGADDFLDFQGIHILDVVTYPNYKKMGYGSQALQLMQEFYEGKWISLDDDPYIYSCKSKSYVTDTQSCPPLLLQLTEVESESIDYLLVSYFLTPDLLRFWKKAEFVPVYISGKKNPAQEHLCLMMKGLTTEIAIYMKESWQSFCEYYFRHLSSDLKCFTSELALNLLSCKFSKQMTKEALKKEDIDIYLKPQRMKALEKYSQNLGDLHCVMPCIRILANLFFKQRFVGLDMSVAQQVILLGFGLQTKRIEEITVELSLHSTQVLGLLNRSLKKLTSYITNIIEAEVAKTLTVKDINMKPVPLGLDDELEEAAQKIREKQLMDLKKLQEMDFSEYAIKGSEDDWQKAVHTGRRTVISIKSVRREPEVSEIPTQEKSKSFKHKKKNMKRKR